MRRDHLDHFDELSVLFPKSNNSPAAVGWLVIFAVLVLAGAAINFLLRM